MITSALFAGVSRLDGFALGEQVLRLQQMQPRAQTLVFAVGKIWDHFEGSPWREIVDSSTFVPASQKPSGETRTLSSIALV